MMRRQPAGIGTSFVHSAGRVLQGKPLVFSLWHLRERRAVSVIRRKLPISLRAWEVTAQGQSQRQSLPPATNQSQVPTPRPPPPLLQRAGDLPERLLRDYLSGWTSQFTEYDYYIPDAAVHGTVPEDIRGTLFLIGPGLTEVYGTSVRHPHDADGMVCSLAFGDGGQIFFRNRYVRTTSFVAEQALGRRISRGFHDRGAAMQSGQQHHPPPQPQHPAQLRDPRAPHLSAGARRSTTGVPPTQGGGHSHNGSYTNAAGAGLGRGGSAGDLAAKRELERSSSWGGWTELEETFSRGSAADLDQARQAVQAMATAASEAVPKPFRFDPLVMLGLPPLPPLSSLFNPLDTSFRAPANASIVYWAGRLLAFTEGGSLPYELNKLSLETVGLYDAAGTMSDIGRLVGGYKIAPAPPQGYASTAPRPNRLVVMGTAQSGGDTLVRWVELGEDGRPAGSPTTYRLPGCWAQGVLDFWVTDSYYVVVQAPLDFNAQRFATQTTIGAASFAECFDWDPSRPSRIHLVARPGGSSAAPAAVQAQAGSAGRGATSSAGAVAAGRGQQKASPKSFVWPPPGPDSIVLDAPGLLPISCVGAFTPAPGSGMLVFDALCQQGLTGSTGGTLDSLDPEDHRYQPKPELVRLLVDLNARHVTARVLSQRTTSAATTASSFSSSPARAASTVTSAAAPSTAASSVPAPVGHGSSFRGGYHHLFTSASATDTSTGWAPSQVLVKLTLPPEDAVPGLIPSRQHAVAPSAATPGGGAGAGLERPTGLSVRRGLGAEIWAPGDRLFVGPPVFVPRWGHTASAAVTGASLAVSAAPLAPGAPSAASAGTGELARAVIGATASPLPPLESEVEAAARRAAAATAARRHEEEQEGWLLVMVQDAGAMKADLCILDARDLTRGPVAVISIPHHLPHARAAHFTRVYCGPGLAAPPGWRPRVASTPGGTAAGGGPPSGAAPSGAVPATGGHPPGNTPQQPALGGERR